MFKKDKNNKSREELLLEDEMIIVPKSKKAKKQFLPVKPLPGAHCYGD